MERVNGQSQNSFECPTNDEEEEEEEELEVEEEEEEDTRTNFDEYGIREFSSEETQCGITRRYCATRGCFQVTIYGGMDERFEVGS